MSKMTKAQGRRRLHEASQKILRVWLANPGGVLSPKDLGEMAKFAQNTIERLERKMR